MIFLCVAFVGYGGIRPGFSSASLDIASRYAGVIMGIAIVCVCVCVCVCVRACVCACVRACVRACVYIVIILYLYTCDILLVLSITHTTDTT